ncbi:SH3 domain-binding glutamic acid-rich-like protein 3 [Hypanus sabinus]|uniref:SH3 domain-binding glutamic acid-rich-like protein 3 n=1 Tax=Hypanus sabinus TaxID=79690 RepID=UPI0028C47393|nr:SH3 domain-binding glutamic acid-rich-like protein 3 [Hypanus sabinus]
MSISVYYASITATVELEKKQKHIESILSSKGIVYKLLDLSANEELKDEMRKKVGDPKAMPPQIFNGDQYCGDYDAFFQAVESEQIESFLKLEVA